jgi:hypothetical protein
VYVNRCLAGLLFEDAGQLLAAIESVLERIEKDFVSGLSRVDGPIKEMYRYQWGIALVSAPTDSR